MKKSEKPFKKEHLTPKIEKKFINSQELLVDSYRLAREILLDKSCEKPTWIVALWRGGCFIGSAVQEYLSIHGVKTDHIAIRTSHYTGIDENRHEIRVHGLHYLLNSCNHEDNLLIVDDVFDTGKSVKKMIDQIYSKMRRNAPKQIKIAVVWWKPKRNLTNLEPDYYIHKDDRWIVFPHELEGLSVEEIEQKEGKMGKEIASLLIPEKMEVNKKK